METLVSAVTNITFKRVTEQEAMEFALSNYGVLATYIKNQHLDKFNIKPKPRFRWVCIAKEWVRIITNN